MNVANYNKIEGTVVLEFSDNVHYMKLIRLRAAFESHFDTIARLTISHDSPTISLRGMDDEGLPEDEEPRMFAIFAQGWFCAQRP